MAISNRSYLLTLLLIIQAFNYVDGMALGLALQSIKLEFGASDMQLGLLSGLAFALFYSVMGIPIARWADRGNRVTIIALAAAVWSLMVALCGMAGSLLQLLLMRVGVAVGEAGCVPPAHSLLADYFPRAERPRAVSIYMLAGSLSTVIGYFVAGWLNQLYGWRVMFIALGLPGLLPAALAWGTLREPRLQTPRAQGGIKPANEQPGLKEVLATLWATRSFRHLLLSYSVLYFFGWGIGQWQPAFLTRSYGMNTGELGSWFAAIYGASGLAGTYLGGRLAARYAPDNERLQLRAMAVTYAMIGAISTFIYLAPDKFWAFGLIGIVTAGNCAAVGPFFATIQTLVPERMRAMSIALVYLFANLIGMGLGPLATGILSDALHPLLGEESLRYALLALSPGYLWGGWHLWRASRSVAGDIARSHGTASLAESGAASSFKTQANAPEGVRCGSR